MAALTQEEIDYIHETAQQLKEYKLCKDMLESIQRTPSSELQTMLLNQTRDEMVKLKGSLHEKAAVLLYKYPLLCDQQIIDDFYLDGYRSPSLGYQYQSPCNTKLPVYYILSYKNTVRFIGQKYHDLFEYSLEFSEDKEKKRARVISGFNYFVDIIFQLLKLFSVQFANTEKFVENWKLQTEKE